MVQLKELTLGAFFIAYTLFQFQYGAAERKWRGHSAGPGTCFNSSMVQLKVGEFDTLAEAIKVSIPVWCSWKPTPGPSTLVFLMFQFQYGAAERSQLSLKSKEKLVSIPVWCSWKSSWPLYLQTYIGFNSSMVQLKVLFCFIWLIGVLVSIPVWCSWKGSGDGSGSGSG